MARASQTPKPSFLEYAQASFHSPLHAWQRDNLCPILQECVEAEGMWLLVHGPPRMGKSFLVSQRLPAWILGMWPDKQIGVASFNETHSEEFSGVVIDIMQSETHKSFFPERESHLASNRPTKKQWQTNARRALKDGQFSFSSLGLNSGAAGKGFDILIIDDPYANYEDSMSEATNAQLQNWWINTIKPRLKANATVIFMFHRWHSNDFIGWVQKREKNKWRMVRFPLVHDGNKDGNDPTDREPGELLSDLKPMHEVKELMKDELTFSALCQGIPLSDSKKMFLRERFNVIPGAVMDNFGDEVHWVRFWDLAASKKKGADYTVGALVGVYRDKIFIRDIICIQEEWPEVRRQIIETTKAGKMGVVTAVGSAAMQIGFVQELSRHPLFMSHSHLQGVPEKGTKKERANVWANLSRLGKVFLAEGDWNEDFFDEAYDFKGDDLTHDDRIDAVSGAMILLSVLREDAELEELEYGTKEYWQKQNEKRIAFIRHYETEDERTDREYAEQYARAYRSTGEYDDDVESGIISLN